MRGKWLPGGAGKDAAGGEDQQPRGRFSLGHTHPAGPCQSQVFSISHLRISQHTANSQQDVSFKWRTPHISSSGYTEN